MNRRDFFAAAGGAAAGFGLAGCSSAPTTRPQTQCPVMGGKINKKIYVDHAGKRVYFCCRGCPKAFKLDPDKYMTKMTEQGIVLDDIPAGGAAAAAASEAGKEGALRSRSYVCALCGNIVDVLYTGGGALWCCGQEMALMEVKTADTTTEKHVPVVEKIDGGYKVVVGSTLHPMTEEHYITTIDLIADGIIHRTELSPGDKPEAVFMLAATDVKAREYCNEHGVWVSSAV